MADLDDALETQTEEEILEEMLTDAAIAGVDIRGMQAERVGRGLFEIQARSMAELQSKRATIVSGGFLGLADDLWLPLLAEGFFQLTQEPATSTVGILRLTDTGNVGPVPKGARSVRAVSADGATQYINRDAFTIPVGSYSDVTFTAEEPGAAGNVANNTITSLTTPIAGVTVSNPAYLATGTWVTTPGRDVETSAALAERCRDRWGSIGAGGNRTAYEFWAFEAFTSADMVATITRVAVDDTNPFGPGSIGVYLANDSGPATGAEVTIVDDYLQDRKALGSGELRTAAATAVPQTVAITISATGNPDAETQAETAIADMEQTLAIGATLYRSAIVQKILNDVDGVYNIVVTTPASDTSLAAGEMWDFTAVVTVV